MLCDDETLGRAAAAERLTGSEDEKDRTVAAFVFLHAGVSEDEAYFFTDEGSPEMQSLVDTYFSRNEAALKEEPLFKKVETLKGVMRQMAAKPRPSGPRR